MTDGPIPSSAGDSGPTGPRAFLQAMRPRHWVKNGFVLAPILFSGRFHEAHAWGWWGLCGLAALAFCLLSSAVYLLNDLCDAQADRSHPVKRSRPIAAGRLSRKAALAGAAALLAGGLGLACAVAGVLIAAGQDVYAWAFLAWAGAYVVLNVLYSFWIKTKSTIDVIFISLGFVLRAMGGASAIAVPFSPWLVLCTFSLCLFLALTKRRSEIVELPLQQRAESRPSTTAYGPGEVEHMIAVAAAVALVMYILYCLAPRTVERFSAHVIWTVPLVTYGLFRYDRLTRQAGQNDPVEVLVRDKVLWIVLALYVLLVGALRACGRLEWAKRILDF